jgi:hypothetical protein
MANLGHRDGSLCLLVETKKQCREPQQPRWPHRHLTLPTSARFLPRLSVKYWESSRKTPGNKYDWSLVLDAPRSPRSGGRWLGRFVLGYSVPGMRRRFPLLEIAFNRNDWSPSTDARKIASHPNDLRRAAAALQARVTCGASSFGAMPRLTPLGHRDERQPHDRASGLRICRSAPQSSTRRLLRALSRFA